MTPRIYLIRHGETEWSQAGRHTGWRDIPLTAAGEAEARALAPRLAPLGIAQVFVSPLQRAFETCRLAGFASAAQPDPDLKEWNYGDYEGRTREEILAQNPTWNHWIQGCPGGELPAQVAARADRVIARLRALPAAATPVALFAHGHFLRVLAARWIDQPVEHARFMLLNTGSISLLTYDHENLAEPAIGFWNARLD